MWKHKHEPSPLEKATDSADAMMSKAERQELKSSVGSYLKKHRTLTEKTRNRLLDLFLYDHL